MLGSIPFAYHYVSNVMIDRSPMPAVVWHANLKILSDSS